MPPQIFGGSSRCELKVRKPVALATANGLSGVHSADIIGGLKHPSYTFPAPAKTPVLVCASP